MQDIKKQAEFETIYGPGGDELDQWIEKNSILEKIPVKSDRPVTSPDRLQRQQPRGQRYPQMSQDTTLDEQFMRSFDYDESNNTRLLNGSDRTSINNEGQVDPRFLRGNSILSMR